MNEQIIRDLRLAYLTYIEQSRHAQAEVYLKYLEDVSQTQTHKPLSEHLRLLKIEKIRCRVTQ